MFVAVFVLFRHLRRAFASADAELRWLIYSLGVSAPPFLLFALTNQRIALLAGVCVGLLSRCSDLARDRRAPTG